MHRPRTVRFAVLLAIFVLAGCGSGKPSEEVKLGGIALTEVLDGLMIRAERALGGITGLESAQATAPTLREINDDFEDLMFHAPKLGPAGQDELAKRARKHQPQLQAMTRAVNESPALGEILGAEMNKMYQELSWLMAPPYKTVE